MKTIIKRPSRYQQNKSVYELTVSGLVMGCAIHSVKKAETEYANIGANIQEGRLVSPDAWNVVHLRYSRARRKLDICRAKIASGHTAANRSC